MNNSLAVRKTMLLILTAHFCVAAGKLIVGYIANSAGLVADGYHSMSDGFTTLAAILGLYMSVRPVDRNHPYGHKKYENITILFIGGILLLVAGNIALDAITRIKDPIMPQITYQSIIVLVVAIAVSTLTAAYEQKKGVELNSPLLLADALHTKSDILTSYGVLITLGALWFGAPPIIDPLISLVIAAFILFAAFKVVKQTSAVLLDAAAVDVEKIKSLALSFCDVAGVHAVRSRQAGEDIYIEMHILINPRMSVKEAHDLVHEIENKFQAEIMSGVQLMIHTEPFNAAANSEYRSEKP